jgi:hypothetical protein
MMYVGIDPGLSGAVGVVSEDGCVVFDIPLMTASDKGKVKWMIDASTLADKLLTATRCRDLDLMVALEQTAAMPGQGVSSMFSMGDSFGACRAVVQTLGLDLTLVRPAKWKKELGLSREKDDSMDMARRLFPDAPLDRKKDHNRAEALLIAQWLQLTHERVQ